MPAPLLASISAAERAQRWLSILTQPDTPSRSTVFVAEQAGQIVGFGSCGRQRTQALHYQGYTAEISSLYVLQASQGRGTGSALMKAMAEVLTSGGHQAAGLWVIERSERARRFYEKLGGEVIGREQDRRDDVALDEVAYGRRDMQKLLQPSLR